MQRYFSGYEGFSSPSSVRRRRRPNSSMFFGAAFLHETEHVFSAPLYTNVLAQGDEIGAPQVEQITA